MLKQPHSLLDRKVIGITHPAWLRAIVVPDPEQID
jgi:hypothetical protein